MLLGGRLFGGEEPGLSKVSDLRAASKHFYQIVVEVVIKLSLKIPLKSLCLELARGQVESIRVIVNAGLFQTDCHLDASVTRSGFPLKKRVLVPRQLLLNLFHIPRGR